jgi:hypothetical protein
MQSVLAGMADVKELPPPPQEEKEEEPKPRVQKEVKVTTKVINTKGEGLPMKISKRFNAKFTTNQGEDVKLDCGRIICRDKEQTLAHPDGKRITSFGGDANAQKYHEDRVRTGLVRAILERVANTALSFRSGSFVDCLQDAKELHALQEITLTIRETNFNENSNAQYVKKNRSEINDIFDCHWQDLTNRNLSAVEKDQINAIVPLFPELNVKEIESNKELNKLEKAAAKAPKAYKKELIKVVEAQKSTLAVIEEIIKDGGDNLINWSNKTIKEKADKAGLREGFALLYRKTNEAKENLIRKGVRPDQNTKLQDNIKALIRKEDVEDLFKKPKPAVALGRKVVNNTKTEVTEHDNQYCTLNGVKVTTDYLKSDEGKAAVNKLLDQNPPVHSETVSAKKVWSSVSLNTETGFLIKLLQNNTIVDADLKAIRDVIIERKELPLLIQFLAHLIAHNLPRSKYVTLGLINAMPDCFSDEDVKEIEDKAEEVELTTATVTRFFQDSLRYGENITFTAVLQYNIKTGNLQPEEIITIDPNLITKRTVELLTSRFPLLAKIIEVSK